MENCERCYYERNGQCKKNPPYVLSDGVHVFPRLDHFDCVDGCGEFKLKSEIELQQFGEMMDRIERGE